MANQHTTSDFQIECFRSANNRLLYRVKRRENWLKIQLLIQLALLVSDVALEQFGLGFSLYLSIPIAFILCSLYISEDRLVGHIVAYLNSLGKSLSKVSNPSLLNLESSEEGKVYTTTTLPMRFLAQIFGFFLLPAGITLFMALSASRWENGLTSLTIVYLILGLLMAWMLISTYQLRKR